MLSRCGASGLSRAGRGLAAQGGRAEAPAAASRARCCAKGVPVPRGSLRPGCCRNPQLPRAWHSTGCCGAVPARHSWRWGNPQPRIVKAPSSPTEPGPGRGQSCSHFCIVCIAQPPRQTQSFPLTPGSSAPVPSVRHWEGALLLSRWPVNTFSVLA